MKKLALALLVSVVTANFCSAQQNYYDITPGNGYGLRFWSSDTYKIHMGVGSEYSFGPVTDYSIKTNMDLGTGTTGRGWTWGRPGMTPIAGLNLLGNMQIAGSFTTGGDIILPSTSGNKQIYTWSGSDANWRIGMSASPGFTTSMATSHVQYLTYNTNAGQGFAVGVNGGQSSFEITGSNHNAFFRGNVGIGNSIPGELLSVKSSVSGNLASFNGPNSALYLQANASTFDLVGWSPVSGYKPIFIRSGGNGLLIDPTGYIGIGTGTSSPSNLLSVQGAGTLGSVFQQKIINGSQTLALGANSTAAEVQSQGAVPLYINYGGNNVIMNATGGNVGIGTTNPGSYKLAVEGKIGAREVNVIATNPWPDYVFAKEYKLRSLEEVKNYIDQNNHLPEVPSAQEVEKNGVNLGEMNALLLKKIEELTLHMIEQQEQIKALHAEVLKLKK